MRRRTVFVVLGLSILVGLILGAAFRVARRCVPLGHAPYANVQTGMSMGQVEALLGAPDRRHVRAIPQQSLSQHIGCTPPDSYPTDEIKAEADEVWRWSRLIDQRTGIVFDAEGRVIFKWMDY